MSTGRTGSASQAEPQASWGGQVRRVAWLDNLRVTLIGGVITAHVATAYIVDVDWYYDERTTSEAVQTAVTFPVFLAAIFGLGPLFLVAGVGSVRSLRAKRPVAFVRGRLLRLGVPLLVFCVLIDPLADYLGDLPEEGQVPLQDYLLDRTGTRDLGPMWFVAALLVFSLAYAAWRAVRPASPRAPEEVSSRWLTGFAAGIAVASWLIWLLWTYTSDTPFNLNLGHWGQAAGLFLLGVFAGERGWLDTLTPQRARHLGWLAVLGMIILTGLAGYQVAKDNFDSMAGGAHWESAVFAALAGAVGVSVSLWVIDWFRRRWDHAGPLAVRAGRGSYAAYVIHPLPLVLLSLACAGLAQPPEVKFLIVAGLGVPLTFAVGYGLTRLPGVRRVL